MKNSEIVDFGGGNVSGDWYDGGVKGIDSYESVGVCDGEELVLSIDIEGVPLIVYFNFR